MIRSHVAFPLAFSSFVLLACSGTDTGNPVVSSGDGGGDYVSPGGFTQPSSGAAPCSPPAADAVQPPQGLPRSRLLQVPDRGSFLAQGDNEGLALWDINDLANPARVSLGAVRGTVHELLSAGATHLWVAATEPPALDQTQVSSADALDPALHLLQLDVRDPAAPVREAELTLTNDFWQMQQRGETLWALTGRLVPSQRGCAVSKAANTCRHDYEAVELHGLVPNGSAFDIVASAELPLGLRVWWGTDGIATLTEDGTLHVLRWDDSGVLQAPLEVPIPGGALDPDTQVGQGPLEIVGNQLLWVGTTDVGATLYRFALDGDMTQPTSSFDLGPSEFSSGVSLFWQNQLWLNSGTEDGEAQLWDLGGANPEPIALPETFSRVLPLPDASLDGYSDLPLALGWIRGLAPQSFDVLTVSGSNVSLAEHLGQANISPTASMPAPAELHGIGTAPAWNMLLRGAGLPAGLDPAIPQNLPTTDVRDFVGIAADSGEPRAEATLRQPPGASPRLEIHTDTATMSFDVPEGSDRLVPVPNGVVVLANEQSSSCRSTEGCARTVTLVDVSGTPRLTGSLPLPTPDVGRPGAFNEAASIEWSNYDVVTGGFNGPQLLDAEHLAFVADLQLQCSSQAGCDALGIQPVPVSRGSSILSGEMDWQSVYVLQIAGSGAPRWQAVGTSSVEAAEDNRKSVRFFAAPRALGGTVAVTRLEPTSLSGDLLPEGQFRFVLDRFRLGGTGKPLVAPAVNIPGFPVAYLGNDADVEYWVSAEPLLGDTGQARLHRLVITADGAESENQIDLDGTFAGFWPLHADSEMRGIALSNPKNACGVAQLSALTLGAPSSGGALQVTSQLDLPSDDWQLLGSDGPRALLRRDGNYALISLDSAGMVQLVGLKSLPDIGNAQLLGTTLRATSRTETVTIDF